VYTHAHTRNLTIVINATCKREQNRVKKDLPKHRHKLFAAATQRRRNARQVAALAQAHIRATVAAAAAGRWRVEARLHEQWRGRRRERARAMSQFIVFICAHSISCCLFSFISI
jgi:hypothetical protein